MTSIEIVFILGEKRLVFHRSPGECAVGVPEFIRFLQKRMKSPEIPDYVRDDPNLAKLVATQIKAGMVMGGWREDQYEGKLDRNICTLAFLIWRKPIDWYRVTKIECEYHDVPTIRVWQDDDPMIPTDGRHKV